MVANSFRKWKYLLRDFPRVAYDRKQNAIDRKFSVFTSCRRRFGTQIRRNSGMEMLSVCAQLATIFEDAAGSDESGASRSFIFAPFSRRFESGCEESRMRKTGSQTETLRGLSVCDRAVGKRLRLFLT